MTGKTCAYVHIRVTDPYTQIVLLRVCVYPMFARAVNHLPWTLEPPWILDVVTNPDPGRWNHPGPWTL